MSEVPKITTENNITLPHNVTISNQAKVAATNFDSQLTSLKVDELIKLFKDNYGATLTVSNVLKNETSVKNFFANLTGNNNIVIAENVLLRMLENPAFMQQIISRVIAYFNVKNTEINALATGLKPTTSGVILFPDGTMGYWPFSFREVESFVALQNSQKEELRKQAHLKRVKDLAKQRHRQIRNKNWLAAYDDVQNKQTTNSRLIDSLLKKDE